MKRASQPKSQFLSAMSVLPMACSAVLFAASVANADSLKILDSAGKTRFFGDVQSKNAQVQMVITDKAGKGLNGVNVELRDQKTNQVAYKAVSGSGIPATPQFPAGTRAALGTQAPTPLDGLVTFQKVQPTTYAAAVSNPNALIGTVNAVESGAAAAGGAGAGGAAGTGGAVAGSGAVAGAAGGATAGTIAGVSTAAVVAGGAVIAGGAAIAISEANDDDDDDDNNAANPAQPIPSQTPFQPSPSPTPSRPISTR